MHLPVGIGPFVNLRLSGQAQRQQDQQPDSWRHDLLLFA
jgi:hypothetical protein